MYLVATVTVIYTSHVTFLYSVMVTIRSAQIFILRLFLSFLKLLALFSRQREKERDGVITHTKNSVLSRLYLNSEREIQ